MILACASIFAEARELEVEVRMRALRLVEVGWEEGVVALGALVEEEGVVVGIGQMGRLTSLLLWQ